MRQYAHAPLRMNLSNSRNGGPDRAETTETRQVPLIAHSKAKDPPDHNIQSHRERARLNDDYQEQQPSDAGQYRYRFNKKYEQQQRDSSIENQKLSDWVL